MNVRISRRARRDFDALIDWLAERSPDAARRAAYNIFAVVDLLGDFPDLGIGDPNGWREKHVQFGRDGFVIRYRRTGRQVTILRIFHARQDR